MIDTQALRKARGAFFTPPEISRYIADWAIRSKDDVVLEPSCGKASFLSAAAASLRQRGKRDLFFVNQLHGIEIHRQSADEAKDVLAASGIDATIRVADFFDFVPGTSYDAVIGNPPYVRYQKHVGAGRAKSLEAALSQGVRLSGLASSWAGFTVQSARYLKKGGRLGLVLPAELLAVSYAGPVRRFLLERFGRVRLIAFENRVFPGVLEEVVLVLAEGEGGASCFEVFQAGNLEALPSVEAAPWRQHRPEDGAKWTPGLVSAAIFDTYLELCGRREFETLVDWGQTYLGTVTGANAFFALTAAEVKAQGLKDDELLAISPPGSRHLRGPRFTRASWESMKKEEARCFLFYPKDKPSVLARRYIDEGEANGIHRAYKCTVRSPWYRVPLVPRPDLFLTYMNHDRPRLVANEADVHILNSLYGVSLYEERKRLGRSLLPIAGLNSLTLLGAEMIGRAYGGGLLKLEPREADRLPLPSRELLEGVRRELAQRLPRVFEALQENGLEGAVKLVDEIVLSGALKVTASELELLRQGRSLLFHRRMTRGRASHVSGR